MYQDNQNPHISNGEQIGLGGLLLKDKNFLSLDDLPPVMTPMDAKEFMGISKRNAYELFDGKQFHVVKAGRRMFCDKENFINWLKGNKAH